MKIKQVINYFSSETKEENFEDYRKSQILAGLLFVMMVTTPIYTIHYLYNDSPSLAFPLIITMPLCVFFLVLLKNTGRVALIANCLTTSMVVLFVVQSYFTGGVESPTLVWMVVIPLLAAVTSGIRSGIVWGVVSILVLVAAYYLDSNGFVFPNDTGHLNQKSLRLVEIIGLLFSILVFSIVSENTGRLSSSIIKQHHHALYLINRAIDVSSDAIHVVDINSHQLYQNKRFLEMFGFKEDELIDQKSLAPLFPGPDIIREILLTVYHGKNWSGELEMNRRDGTKIPVFMRSDALFDDKGRAYALIGTFTDITEQKKFTQALKESEEKYRVIAENANDVIWIRDLSMKLIYISPGVERMRGFSQEEAASTPIEQSMTPESLAKAAQEFERALENFKSNPDAEKKLELEMYKKGGDTGWYEMSIRFLKDEQGKPTGIIGITRDINERKDAEEALRQARSEAIENAHRAGMADIASSTLHNVGNILNSVKTSIHTAGSTLFSSSLPELKKANQMLKKHEHNLEHFLVNDPLGNKLIEYYYQLQIALEQEQKTLADDIDRIDDKVTNITHVIVSQQRYAGFSGLKEDTDLEALINDVLEIESEIINSTSVQITTELEKLPKIRVQKTKILNILVNLIKNAVDAMIDTPKGQRHLNIKLLSEDDIVLIKVQDTGIGITQEEMAKIFTHGYSTKSEGHGFGLHSSAIYMEEMGAKIRVKSEGRNQGTMVILEFPMLSA